MKSNEIELNYRGETRFSNCVRGVFATFLQNIEPISNVTSDEPPQKRKSDKIHRGKLKTNLEKYRIRNGTREKLTTDSVKSLHSPVELGKTQ